MSMSYANKLKLLKVRQLDYKRAKLSFVSSMLLVVSFIIVVAVVQDAYTFLLFSLILSVIAIAILRIIYCSYERKIQDVLKED